VLGVFGGFFSLIIKFFNLFIKFSGEKLSCQMVIVLDYYFYPTTYDLLNNNCIIRIGSLEDNYSTLAFTNRKYRDKKRSSFPINALRFYFNRLASLLNYFYLAFRD
jgi:hypothetical protein